MTLTFFDRNGAPVAYTDDGEHLFSFRGSPVGYLHGESVYSFSGQHLGTFEAGWLRDHAGNAALFSDDAFDGPIKPIKHILPIKSIKHIKPVKGIRQIAPIKPIKSLGWSNLSGEQFFEA